jgi:hypothetical protein
MRLSNRGRIYRMAIFLCLLVTLFLSAFLINKALAQSACPYAVCDRTDRLQATYSLVDNQTIRGAFPNGRTAIFRAVENTDEQVINFEANQSDFCFIPGRSEGPDPKGRHLRVQNHESNWPASGQKLNIDIFAFENGQCVDPAQGSAALLVGSDVTSGTGASSGGTSSSGGVAGTTGPGSDCKRNFLFLPPWNKYLDYQRDEAGSCRPADSFEFPNDLLAVGLAILEMLIRLAGFVAVVSIILAGVQYITSGGNSEKAGSALRRIYNSFIGLAIVLVAVQLISYLGNRLG